MTLALPNEWYITEQGVNRLANDPAFRAALSPMILKPGLWADMLALIETFRTNLYVFNLASRALYGVTWEPWGDYATRK